MLACGKRGVAVDLEPLRSEQVVAVGQLAADKGRATGQIRVPALDAAVFEIIAGRLFEIGYDEIGLYYPIDAQRDAMEDASVNAITRLRA